jgi:two-component sensor histidine kinase
MPDEALTLEGEPFAARLGSDGAIAFGLIVNELLTNALKYGWSEDVGQPIAVRRALGDGVVHVEIENAVLAPEGRMMESASSGLGTELVESFVSNIEARLEAEERDGRYHVRLTVPLGARDGADAAA